MRACACSKPMVWTCPQEDIPRPADLPIIETLLPSASVDSGYYDRGDGLLNPGGMERRARKSLSSPATITKRAHTRFHSDYREA